MFLFNSGKPSLMCFDLFDAINGAINGTVNLGFGIYDRVQDYYRDKRDSEQSQSNFDAQMDFANRQHNDQMSIAREQMENEKTIADRNFGLQQEQFDYQKQLNATQMEREDNAMQRKIADYGAAGLSPLAAIDGSQGAAANPLTSSDAPQYDTSGLNSSYGSWLSAAQQYAELGMAAYSGKASRDSQLANMRNSASLTRSQMRQQMILSNRSLAMQVFDAKANARLKNAQASELETRTRWMQEHGYRDDPSFRNSLYGSQKEYYDILNSFNRENGVRNMSFENLATAFLTGLLNSDSGKKLSDGFSDGVRQLNDAGMSVLDEVEDFLTNSEYKQVRKAIGFITHDGDAQKVYDSLPAGFKEYFPDDFGSFERFDKFWRRGMSFYRRDDVLRLLRVYYTETRHSRR